MDMRRKEEDMDCKNAGYGRSVCVLGENAVSGCCSDTEHNESSRYDIDWALCAGCASRWWETGLSVAISLGENRGTAV